MRCKINSFCWLFPVFYFLMVWLFMEAPDTGTDFAGQLYRLRIAEGQPLTYFVDSNNGPMLYDFLYAMLHNYLLITPRFYIAALSFVYFAIIFLLCKHEANRASYPYLTSSSLSAIVVYTSMCYSPLFICISRFHFATILVLLGTIIFYYQESKFSKSIAV